MFVNCRTNAQIEIKVDGVNTERVSEITFLGVIIDNKTSCILEILSFKNIFKIIPVDNTHSIFLQSKLLKLKDLVDF